MWIQVWGRKRERKKKKTTDPGLMTIDYISLVLYIPPSESSSFPIRDTQQSRFSCVLASFFHRMSFLLYSFFIFSFLSFKKFLFLFYYFFHLIFSFFSRKFTVDYYYSISFFLFFVSFFRSRQFLLGTTISPRVWASVG